MTRHGLPLFSALLAVTLVLGACGGTEATLAGYEREPDPTVGTYSLPAVNRGDANFVFQADPGELLMVYFAFTNCPDFCPTTLADTRIALNEIGERADDVDVAVITVDPDRDTAEILTNYVETFIDDGIALRTEDQGLLRDTAFAFGADYRIVTDDAGEDAAETAIADFDYTIPIGQLASTQPLARRSAS